MINGWSTLMLASQSGHTEVVNLLHKNGAQVDLQDNNGFSPLIIACQNGHTEAVKLLIEHGAQVDLQNDSGSALIAASEDGNVKLLK